MPCPALFNPADHLLAISSIDHSSPEAEEECKQRMARICENVPKTVAPPAPSAKAHDGMRPGTQAGYGEQSAAGPGGAGVPGAVWWTLRSESWTLV